ncbi:hypothetical protein ES708_24870 [subsurface metagenome]
MHAIIQTIGFISAILTTSAFLPQAIKTWRTRSTEDLSPMMFALFFLGIIGWLIYGILRSDLPMILANAITICLAGIIMFFIIRPDNTRKIAHLGLYVNDLENMKDFYVGMFKARAGEKYDNPYKGFSSYFLTFSTGAKLELMHKASIEEPEIKTEWGHVAISTGSTDAVNSLIEKLRFKGVPVLSEPRYTGDGYYECIVCDPENNLIEISA